MGIFGRRDDGGLIDVHFIDRDTQGGPGHRRWLGVPLEGEVHVQIGNGRKWHLWWNVNGKLGVGAEVRLHPNGSVTSVVDVPGAWRVELPGRRFRLRLGRGAVLVRPGADRHERAQAGAGGRVERGAARQRAVAAAVACGLLAARSARPGREGA